MKSPLCIIRITPQHDCVTCGSKLPHQVDIDGITRFEMDEIKQRAEELTESSEDGDRWIRASWTTENGLSLTYIGGNKDGDNPYIDVATRVREQIAERLCRSYISQCPF